MAVTTGAEVAEEAKSTYLNFGGITDLSILPIINAEYRDLQRRLRNINAPIMKKTWGPITVTAVTKISLIPATDGFNDIIHPLVLQEKPTGANDIEYVDMHESFPLPIRAQNQALTDWTWKQDIIILVGALTTRQVLIHGKYEYPILAKITDPMLLRDAGTYLAAAVASKAALTIGRNRELSNDIRLKYVDPYLLEVLNQYGQKQQTMPFRHRTWRRGI